MLRDAKHYCMLVTAFTTRGALVAPPSCFEAHAAQTATNKQSRDEWTQFARRINTATKKRDAKTVEIFLAVQIYRKHIAESCEFWGIGEGKGWAHPKISTVVYSPT